MKEILETYTMTPEEEIKWLRQCVRELQERNEKTIEYIEQLIDNTQQYSYYDITKNTKRKILNKLRGDKE